MDANDLLHEAKAVGNSAERALALDGNFPNGKALGAIEAEDGEEGWRIWDGCGIKAIEDLECKDAGCEIFGNRCG